MRVERHHLEAECRRLDGKWRDTHLDLDDCDRGIVNDNGRLACSHQETQRLPPGSYRDSCRDFTVDSKHLDARCRNRKGEWRDTHIDLTRCRGQIGNDDGRLVCH